MEILLTLFICQQFYDSKNRENSFGERNFWEFHYFIQITDSMRANEVAAFCSATNSDISAH